MVVYKGKAFAAIIDDVWRGRVGHDPVAIFIHTGGLPMLSNVAAQIAPAVTENTEWKTTGLFVGALLGGNDTDPSVAPLRDT